MDQSSFDSELSHVTLSLISMIGFFSDSNRNLKSARSSNKSYY
ncbi:hypothetical protein LEP1GSC058_1316 [Leptospira fainei serovar Hurstbridge str. BUT 6]|uniref:Uncharacterized protein n=1 Tax=Leptospira fainei serovar Hurstbridge str. BUT 6 TaxID=1193011 RepID=S3W8F2_9LEPT|nr:hypothetical protein LEP1GSC058_1316 [Leptospira fainei serovar Hurstbridge str. BUT 6]